MAIKSDDICVTHVDVQTAGIVQPRYGFVHQMNGLIDMIVAGTSGIFVADILLDPSHFQTCNVESLGAARYELFLRCDNAQYTAVSLPL